MATVFLAVDERLERHVAVKRLRTDAPEASITRFEREARLGAALNHPNLVAVYDTVAADEGALIVMEYVPGSSLADITARGALPPDRALRILRCVAEALDHAHSQDVVHRDVKPSNVLVRDDGLVKLADLGIARAVGATQLTSEGSVIGTLPYMAPERMRGPGSGGPESDVYALAAVAYEMLSGDPPEAGSRTHDEPPDLRSGWPTAPGTAAEVLERGLDPAPRRRQTTATRLIDELGESITAEAPGTATVTRPMASARTVPFEPPPTRTATTRRIRSRRRRRGLAIGAVLTALVAIAAIALVAGVGDDGAKKAPQQRADPEPKPAPDGAALNDQGFNLIENGEFEAAIPLLREAVAALEGSGDELTYNYALFNLGNALLRAGRVEEAIPLLEERLLFPNQTGEVEGALNEAFEALSGGSLGAGEEGDE